MDSGLRIDDRLDTALRNSLAAEQGAAIGQWRQLIDLLAQNPANFNFEHVAAGLVRVRQMRDSVTVIDRAASVNALKGRILSAPLVQLLASDQPAVAAAAISGARLLDEEWAAIIPSLSVRARGFLRMRSDLGSKTQQALSYWSSGDFVLQDQSAQPAVQPATGQISPENKVNAPQPIAPVPDASNAPVEIQPETGPETGPESGVGIAPPSAIPQLSQSWRDAQLPIGKIVERIEQWRRDRANNEAPLLPFAEELPEVELPPATEIRFETDDNGTVIWVEGAPRGAIVGVDIARAAYDNGPGPDAYGAAAFRQRMPMESARMRLRGSAIVEGDWRMSASPFFDAQSGRFRGFRGIMRRPLVTETADLHSKSIQHAEQLQQVIHELRTPLGAIAGFAEIIEQQLFGPVSREYRELAKTIIDDANQLLAGFDDLMMAAKIDNGRLEVTPGITDCTWLTQRLADRLRGVSDSLNVNINLMTADPVRPFAVERELAERLFSRLLAAIIMGCSPGETLDGRFNTEIGQFV